MRNSLVGFCDAATGSVAEEEHMNIAAVRSRTKITSPTWLSGLGALLLLAMGGQPAIAANYSVAAGVAKFDCAVARPGDTITLAAGARGPLAISNCPGTSTNPITVKNDVSGSGPTVIQQSSGTGAGFVLLCTDCIGVVFDGSGKWAGAPSATTYGIKVTMTGGSSPTAFIKVAGKSRFVTIKNVEVDGRWPSLSKDGIGISVNDNTVFAADNPELWRVVIVIANSYVHNIQGEGMYLGPNWPSNGLPLRNITIRDNRVEDTGWDCIQLKSAISGDNQIHHNVVKRCGKNSDGVSGQHHGISLYEGNGKIYNNWVEETGESGIQHYLDKIPSSYGNQTAEIYNNVVVKTGLTGPLAGHGITCASNTGGVALNVSRVYNNTVVAAEGVGIRIGSTAASGLVRDNIVVDSIGTPISVPSSINNTNNLVSTSAKALFINAGGRDYRLQASSPARNAGSSTYPAVDHDDIRRPQEGAADQGAFEFHSSDVMPMPPENVVIE